MSSETLPRARTEESSANNIQRYYQQKRDIDRAILRPRESFNKKNSLQYILDSETIKSNPILNPLDNYSFNQALAKYHEKLFNLRPENNINLRLAENKIVSLQSQIHDIGMAINKPVQKKQEISLIINSETNENINYRVKISPQNQKNLEKRLKTLKKLLQENMGIRQKVRILFRSEFNEKYINNFLQKHEVDSSNKINDDRIVSFYKMQMQKIYLDLKENIQLLQRA